jgi:hypothetical protein
MTLCNLEARLAAASYDLGMKRKVQRDKALVKAKAEPIAFKEHLRKKCKALEMVIDLKNLYRFETREVSGLVVDAKRNINEINKV